jgi:hypothetical protein
LRYRCRRGLEDPLRRLWGKITGGFPYLGGGPARKKEKRRGEGNASVKIAKLHIFIMVSCIPFVKMDRLDGRQKMEIPCPESPVLQLGAPCRKSNPAPARLIR